MVRKYRNHLAGEFQLETSSLPAQVVLAKLVSSFTNTGLPQANWRAGEELPPNLAENLRIEAIKHGWLVLRNGIPILTARGEFACGRWWKNQDQTLGLGGELSNSPSPLTWVPSTSAQNLSRLTRVGGEELALTICGQVFGWSYARGASLSRFCKACYQQVRRRYLGKTIVGLALARGWIEQINQGTKRLYVLTKKGYAKLKGMPITSHLKSPMLLGDLLAGM